MSQAPIVATAVGNLLADLGARRCFGVLGTANFKVTHALSEAGVEFKPLRAIGRLIGFLTYPFQHPTARGQNQNLDR